MDMVTATLMFMASKASIASNGPQPLMSDEAHVRPRPVRFHTGPRKSFHETLEPTEPP